MATKRYQSGWAILAIDPGGTSGLAEAIVPRRVSVADSMRRARIKTYELGGSVRDQSVQAALNYLSFIARAQMKYGIPIERCFLAIESFQVRQRNVELSPLEIRWALEGLLYQHDVTFVEQTPSQSKTFATDERLRAWGCYVRGSAHMRDATRHVALCVANQIARQ